MDAKEMLELLNTHPLTQALQEERNARVLQRRQEAAAKIEELKREAETTILQRQAALDAVEAELKAHDEARKAIVNKVATARAALTGERQRLDRETSEAEGLLVSSCDRRIDEAIQFFQARREGLLRKTPDSDRYGGKTNPFTLTKEVVSRSNAGAIKDALTYCLACIKELECMRLAPTLDAGRIEDLRRNVPDIGEMTEASTEKPLPRVNTDPRSLLPSDTETEWKLGKLNDKFKKLMGR